MKRLSIEHVIMDIRVPYWYCYRMGQTLTFGWLRAVAASGARPLARRKGIETVVE